MGKEIPFFSDDERFAKGWKSFANEYYGHPSQGLIRGKVTNYMSDPRSPGRIGSLSPGTKLIAILRNPLERALSHHMMTVRRGQETQSFDQSVQRLLDPKKLVADRARPYIWDREADCYVVWGEYGRILAEYLEVFPRDQMLVLFTEDLESDPGSVLDRILEFLELPAGWRPKNFGKKYHSGGYGYRFAAWRSFYRSIPGSPTLNGLGRIALKILPTRQRHAFYFWKEIWLTKSAHGQSKEMSLRTREMLIEHYQQDVRLLESSFGFQVPWEEFAIGKVQQRS
jgi:hypothetical protein